jgi:hypothetical protein
MIATNRLAVCTMAHVPMQTLRRIERGRPSPRDAWGIHPIGKAHQNNYRSARNLPCPATIACGSAQNANGIEGKIALSRIAATQAADGAELHM